MRLHGTLATESRAWALRVTVMPTVESSNLAETGLRLTGKQILVQAVEVNCERKHSKSTLQIRMSGRAKIEGTALLLNRRCMEPQTNEQQITYPCKARGVVAHRQLAAGKPTSILTSHASEGACAV